MTAGWVGFICGLVVGVPFGMIALAVCIAAKRGDQGIDQMFSDVVPPAQYQSAQVATYMRLFCKNSHEWFGVCMPAVCPECGALAIGGYTMTDIGLRLNMTVLDALNMVLKERQRSIQLHGLWRDYSLEQMMSVIINELMVEAGAAESVGDIHGEHGVIRELSQVAACCIKAIMVLSDRAEGHLAETLRAEGAHSCFEGRALHASPSLRQGKETISNSPIEGDR